MEHKARSGPTLSFLEGGLKLYCWSVNDKLRKAMGNTPNLHRPSCFFQVTATSFKDPSYHVVNGWDGLTLQGIHWARPGVQDWTKSAWFKSWSHAGNIEAVSCSPAIPPSTTIERVGIWTIFDSPPHGFAGFPCFF